MAKINIGAIVAYFFNEKIMSFVQANANISKTKYSIIDIIAHLNFKKALIKLLTYVLKLPFTLV